MYLSTERLKYGKQIDFAVAQACHPSTRELQQQYCHEFQVSLDLILISRLPGYRVKFCSKNQKQKQSLTSFILEYVKY